MYAYQLLIDLAEIGYNKFRDGSKEYELPLDHSMPKWEDLDVDEQCRWAIFVDAVLTNKRRVEEDHFRRSPEWNKYLSKIEDRLEEYGKNPPRGGRWF